jgi:hypothetical protein
VLAILAALARRRSGGIVERMRLALLTFVIMLSCACNRWEPNVPRQLAFTDPITAHEATLATLRLRGYTLLENDPGRHFVRVLAQTGSTDSSGGSYLNFQIFPNGVLTVTATGRLVRDGGGSIHRKLAEEMDDLVAEIVRTTHAMVRSTPPLVPMPPPPPADDASATSSFR